MRPRIPARRRIAGILALVALAVLPAGLAGARNLDPTRPNVLILYFDDLGYGDLGANDPTRTSLTPRLDAVATQSLRFVAGHSAASVCTPSRYAILTGRYAWRTTLKARVTGGYSKPLLEAGRFTIANMFQSLGYATAMVGKWHIGMQFRDPSGNPVDLDNDARVLRDNKIDFSQPLTDTPVHRGFDYFYGTAASPDMPPYCWIENDTVLYKGGVVSNGAADFSQAVPATNSQLEEGFHPGGGLPGAYDPTFVKADYLQLQAGKVSALLGARAADSRPFFIYVSMPAPHSPWAVQPAFSGRSGFTYGDYVLQTDHYAGVILDALADPDGDPATSDSLADNTVVFISSDNGPEVHAFTRSRAAGHDANGPLRGVKRDNWEGGTRVPFMIRWPGKVAPGITDHPCWQGDFFATMAAYVGYDMQRGEAPDAESFLPILLGLPLPAARRAAFIQHASHSQFAIVEKTGVWKLLDGTGGGGNTTSYDADDANLLTARGTVGGTPRQLFNLRVDPGERQNLLDPGRPPSQEALNREIELMTLLNDIRGNTSSGTDGDSRVPPPDNDADDMSNAYENRHPGLDRNDPSDRDIDQDGDGLTSVEEYRHGSDPNDVDSDDDRLGDYAEVRTYGTRPATPHSDPDFLPDGDEVLVWNTDPLAADTDGDGVHDDVELAAFSNPRNAEATPLPGPRVVWALNPAAVQLVGAHGDANDPRVNGDAGSGWSEAGPLFVRERTTFDIFDSWRTRLFLRFDLTGLRGTLEGARLRMYQVHRLNTAHSATIELARVTQAWEPTAGRFPQFDATPVAPGFAFGNNGDFGMAVDATGFYGGAPGSPGSDDGGFDPFGQVTSIVQGWQDGSISNYGFRIAFGDRAYVGAAFSDADIPASPGTNEALQLLVTTRPLTDSLDTDGDLLLDSYEMEVFGDLGAIGDDDQDSDHVSNLVEQALGSDPTSEASRPLFDLVPGDADGTTFSYHRHRTAGLGYEVLVSDDLADWKPYITYFDIADPAPASDLGADYDKVGLTPHSVLPDRLFLRLRVHALAP